MTEPISQEYLNAFVDDELAASEREQALARLAVDEEFKRAVCELRTLKAMVHGAYAQPQPATLPMPARNRHFWRQAWVAGLCLAVGLGGGWFVRDLGTRQAPTAPLAGLPDGYRAVALAARVNPDNIVLHLDSGDPERIAGSLELARHLLRARGTEARVEVVVNSYGLDMLRQGSPQQQVIERLARDHANLAFVACGQTIARLKREGDVVRLVPEAGVAASAIGEITTRMSQGWVYVRV